MDAAIWCKLGCQEARQFQMIQESLGAESHPIDSGLERPVARKISWMRQDGPDAATKEATNTSGRQSKHSAQSRRI